MKNHIQISPHIGHRSLIFSDRITGKYNVVRRRGKLISLILVRLNKLRISEKNTVFYFKLINNLIAALCTPAGLWMKSDASAFENIPSKKDYSLQVLPVKSINIASSYKNNNEMIFSSYALSQKVALNPRNLNIHRNDHASSVKRNKWDGTRIPRITQICTDDKVSADIRQIRAIRVLFQLGIGNHTYLSHFTKRYALNQSNSLTNDQWKNDSNFNKTFYPMLSEIQPLKKDYSLQVVPVKSINIAPSYKNNTEMIFSSYVLSQKTTLNPRNFNIQKDSSYFNKTFYPLKIQPSKKDYSLQVLPVKSINIAPPYKNNTEMIFSSYALSQKTTLNPRNFNVQKNNSNFNNTDLKKQSSESEILNRVIKSTDLILKKINQQKIDDVGTKEQSQANNAAAENYKNFIKDSLKEISINEVSIAERVYKIIERKISIEKDRRGLF